MFYFGFTHLWIKIKTTSVITYCLREVNANHYTLVAYFKVLSQSFPGRTEGNHEKQVSQAMV
jgi:hypothetical protein